MPRDPSRRSSKTSIVSVDQTVASHITRGAKGAGAGAGASTTINNDPGNKTVKSVNLTSSGHAKIEPLSARSNIAHSNTAKGHGRTQSAPHRNSLKKRSNSLRRAKNSTEVLKLRVANGEKSETHSGKPAVKHGRNFTVSNVSTGGFLHLSPSPHQGTFTSPLSNESPYSFAPAIITPVSPTVKDSISAQQQQHTRTRSVSPKRLLGRVALTKSSKELTRPSHTRSQSFSTLDESRKSIHASLQPKTLKIIINRPESLHISEDEDIAPTLQIPIPHYKLGTPRFSAHGTPFIRGASYSRASGYDSTNHSSMTEGYNGPPLSSLRAFSKIQQSLASQESMIPMPDPLRIQKLADARSMSTTSYMSPITADLYDTLLKHYDDSVVVRYANDEKDVAAATKIRIIAQISSESFMDYDLVSDFFLTFRSYMTTFEVLDYLLARLKWSVGRLSEDGRIIRIRTFAALRHWILNYFAEDFVINRHLRLRFCQEVNDLYESVKNRPRGMAGVSDLKILQDLKRCWNGRCALYWDAEAFNMDTDQEKPLQPGGVLGSRNPAYADISEATAALGLGLQGMIETPLSSVSSRSTRKTNHKRLPSSDYAKKPLSIGSEQSIQPVSCSIPRSRSKAVGGEKESSSRGPQPVSVLSRRHNAPSDLKVHIHKPSTDDAGLAPPIDSYSPVEALVQSGHYIDIHAGSMIRGFVYGPVEPFIQLPMNPPLSPSVRFSGERSSTTSPRSPADSSYHSGTQTPAVKNIFGSIRRALSGKQGSNEVTLITVSAPKSAYVQPGRRTPAQMSSATSHDDLRKRALAGKTQLRIDMLGAAAVQSFQAVVPGSQEQLPSSKQQNRTRPQRPDAALSPPLSAPPEAVDVHLPARLPSHYTARSGSILIVDDTAVAMPVMSGALTDTYVHSRNLSLRQSAIGLEKLDDHASLQTQLAAEDIEAEPTDSRSSDGIGVAKTTSYMLTPMVGEDMSRTGSAITVRRLESPAMIGNHPISSDAHPESTRADSPPPMTEATSTMSESPVSKAPLHGLRRRPGGDLKKNQNVQDMEITLHHQSLDSMLASSSTAGSLLIMGRPMTASTNSPPTARGPPPKVSMIVTDTSHRLQPEFQNAVANFSGIPDGDDGGLEATLLKLEGRYEARSSIPSQLSTSPASTSLFTSSEKPYSTSTNPTDQEAFVGHGLEDAKQGRLTFLHGASNDSDVPKAQPRNAVHRSKIFGLPTESPAESDSEESEISLPILKRNTKSPPVIVMDRTGDANDDDDEARSSSDILDTGLDPSTQIMRPDTVHTDGGRSFLLDEDENISDLSSEISVDILTYTDTAGVPVSSMFAAPGTAISGLEIPSHPLTHASLVNLAMQTSPALNGSSSFVAPMLTPQASPQTSQGPDHLGKTNQQRRHLTFAESAKPPFAAGPAHVPFILAYESDVLAQQFTMVEQSALTEIEWTDLVEMRWSNDKSTTTLDWAEYMAKHDDAKGVDVVATRFNLVIKWVLCEIVLTQDIEERARVLSKFIHVAAHARRLRNYATMLQITIALMSTSCSRLKKTWDIVPGHDKSVLRHMEKLAQPLRNFHDLRLEMESTDLTDGCIPFLGLYIHDLTYNAQKPTEIQVAEGLEPLINFERFRTGAIIVKGLLRLIDASLRYDFEPLHGIIERCLWLSALADDRIDALSKALE